MKRRLKKQIIVNKTIEPPKPKKPTLFDKLCEVDYTDKFSAVYNFFAIVYEKIMQARTFFLIMALALASIDVIFAGSAFKETYSSLGHYATWIVMIFVLAEFGAVKAIMIDLSYKSLPVVPPTRSQDIKVQAEYEQKKLQRDSKERVRKIIHNTKTYFVKGMAVVLLVALASFFINFSYSKLSSATSSQIQNSESYIIQKQVIMNNIESLNRQIDQKYASIKVLPESYISKRQSEEEILKSLEEERRQLNNELSDIVSGKKGIEETASLQIRHAANALGVDVQRYLGMINLGVSIGLVSLYLIFFFLSQTLPDNKKLVIVKKIKRNKK